MIYLLEEATMKHYTLQFDRRGFFFVLVILFPTLLWSFYPSMNVVIPGLDGLLGMIEQGLRVLLLFLLCAYPRQNTEIRLFRSFGFWLSLVCVLLYYGSWYLFYFGNTSAIIYVLLTITPSLAFLAYATTTKHYLALVVVLAFACLHNYPTLLNLWTSL